MIAKLVAGAGTLLLNIGVGIAVFVMMLLAMNGFNESDANYGIVAYIAMAVIVSLAMAPLAAVTVHILTERNWNAAGAAALGIFAFTILGAVLKVVCSIIGVLVAELVRVNFR